MLESCIKLGLLSMFHNHACVQRVPLHERDFPCSAAAQCACCKHTTRGALPGRERACSRCSTARSVSVCATSACSGPSTASYTASARSYSGCARSGSPRCASGHSSTQNGLTQMAAPVAASVHPYGGSQAAASVAAHQRCASVAMAVYFNNKHPPNNTRPAHKPPANTLQAESGAAFSSVHKRRA